jgi:hypothetical protein
MSDEGNPHGFTRDVDVEIAAVNLFGMSADEVHRTRIMDLRDMVRQRIMDADEGESKDQTTTKPSPMTPRTVSRQAAGVVTDSEIGMLPQADMLRKMVPAMASKGVRRFMESIPAGEEDLKGLEYVTAPININSIVQASRGMEKLHEYVDSALNSATDAEHAIQQKTSILSMSRSVLDEEDTDWIRESMKCDTRRLLLIMKWMNGVMEDLMQLIRQRLDVESNLQEIPRGGCSAVIAKMHTKTMKMKTIYSVMSSRVDCIMVPPEYADLP